MRDWARITPDGESTVNGQRSTVDRRPSTLHPHPTGTELLDDASADDAQVRESLRNIARANRWFGGTRAVRWAVTRLLRAAPAAARPLVLLDVGAGAGDLARAARSAAGACGVNLGVICLDRHRIAAALATAAGHPALTADAGALPLADRSVDIVLLSQLVHHFDLPSSERLLRESARVARRGIIVADLQPSRLAAALFRPAAHALGFDRITIHDGLTSLRRAYSRAELAMLMQRAGLTSRVTRRPGWRLVALARLA
jgi:ubiquinone/menaquinone biosynthesis C-methylase UbiE